MSLVLTLKINEKVQIGKDIFVSVKGKTSSCFSVAIDAPIDVVITRPRKHGYQKETSFKLE